MNYQYRNCRWWCVSRPGQATLCDGIISANCRWWCSKYYYYLMHVLTYFFAGYINAWRVWCGTTQAEEAAALIYKSTRYPYKASFNYSSDITKLLLIFLVNQTFSFFNQQKHSSSPFFSFFNWFRSLGSWFLIQSNVDSFYFFFDELKKGPCTGSHQLRELLRVWASVTSKLL